jgi:hypothetical protein
MNKLTFSILMLTMSIMTPAYATEADISAKKAEELIKAAQNYQVASEARTDTAEALLSLAREYRLMEYANETERQSRLKTAGNQERQAANLLVAACSGHDKTASALRKAAAEYSKASSPARAEEATRDAKAATSRGTAACRRAAEAYEFSSEAFSTIDLGQMAASSEKAAQMREKLASRIE